MSAKLLINILSAFKTHLITINFALDGISVFDKQKILMYIVRNSHMEINTKHPKSKDIRKMVEAHLREWSNYPILDMEKKQKVDLNQITMQ